MPIPFSLCPENAQGCICGSSEVRTNTGSFIIKWIQRLKGSTIARVCFYSNNILTCRNHEVKHRKGWQVNEITLKISPRSSDSAKQFFATKRLKTLNFKHYWLSCHLLHAVFSIHTFTGLEKSLIQYTIIIIILTYLTYSFHWCHHGIAIRNQLCPGWRPYRLSLSNQPLHIKNEQHEAPAGTGKMQSFWKVLKGDSETH